MTATRTTLTCVDLDDDGAGVTSPDDRPRVHVAGALPGEQVVASIVHVSQHGPDAWATLDAVATPSPDRRAPACAAFGRCGGCVLQHYAYEAQLAWKQARVARALAGLDVTIAACVASPRPLGYRNRSKLVAARAGGKLVLGAYAPRSHDVVDTAGCRIAEPPLDETASALAALLDGAGVAPYDERTRTGQLRHVALRAAHDGRVLAAWVTARPLVDGAALARAFRAARPEVIGVVEHVNRSAGNAIFAGGGEPDTVLDGAASIDDRAGRRRPPAAGCGCPRARSSRPTAPSRRWRTRRSRARWPCAPANVSSTPTAASAASRWRSPATRARSSASKRTPARSPTPWRRRR